MKVFESFGQKLSWYFLQSSLLTKYVLLLGEFLNVNNPILLSAAINGIGVIGKTFALPLPNEAEKNCSKKSVTDKLFSIFTNGKSNSKVLKENIF